MTDQRHGKKTVIDKDVENIAPRRRRGRLPRNQSINIHEDESLESQSAPRRQDRLVNIAESSNSRESNLATRT